MAETRQPELSDFPAKRVSLENAEENASAETHRRKRISLNRAVFLKRSVENPHLAYVICSIHWLRAAEIHPSRSFMFIRGSTSSLRDLCVLCASAVNRSLN